MRPSRAIFTIIAAIIVLPIFLLSTIIFYNLDELIRLFLVRVVQRKVGRGSGALVSLDDVSLSFGCGSGSGGGGNKKIAGDGGGGTSCWNMEMRHLHIGNVPRNGSNTTDEWDSPYAVHLNRTYLSVSGPMAYLSLIQLSIASSVFESPSLPRIFCNGLDFVVGFRVRSVDVVEIDGLTVHIEDGEEEAEDKAVLKHGLLQKLKGKKYKTFDFVLEKSRLSWYEPTPGMLEEKQQQLQKQNWETKDEDNELDEAYAASLTISLQNPNSPKERNKSRGSLWLFASSSIEVIGGDQMLGVELISDKHCLILRASSIEERDAWFDALSTVIFNLQQDPHGGGGGNAPWLEARAAESNARKVRWRRWERRRQHEWQRRWQLNAENDRVNDNFDDNDEDVSDDGGNGERAPAAGGNANGEEDDAEDDGNETTGEGEGSVSKGFIAGIRNFGRRSSTKHGKKFEDALEWRIGRMAVRDLALHIDERHWSLDENGWSLRGFVGSTSELKRRLRFGLGPKLLFASGGRAIKTGISGYTGKEEYAFGDLTKSTVTKMGAGVVDAVHSFTGKEEYEFGDIAKTAVTKVGAGVADVVHGFTGKEEYEFGDIAKTAVTKVGAGVADVVHGFTGKEEYEFGDIAKTAVTKVGAGVADAVYDFTGKEKYEFGDVTKTAVTKVSAGVADAVHDFTGKEKYEFGDVTKTAVTKVGAGVADAVHDFTGKEKYEFGDVTKTVLSKLMPFRSKKGRSKSDELNDKHKKEL